MTYPNVLYPSQYYMNYRIIHGLSAIMIEFNVISGLSSILTDNKLDAER